MSSTPENKVKAKVKDLLRDHGAYWFMPVQVGYGMPGLDFHCCHRGRALFIETKAPGKLPTPRQYLTMEAVAEAGGKVFVIDGENGQLEALADWLNTEGWHSDYD